MMLAANKTKTQTKEATPGSKKRPAPDRVDGTGHFRPGPGSTLFSQRYLGNSYLQTKLTIGRPGDKYEREADRMADFVTRLPAGRLQGRIISDEEETEEILRTRSVAGRITPLIQRQAEEEEEEEEASLQTKLLPGLVAPVIQRQEAPEEEKEEALVQTKTGGGQPPQVTPNLAAQIRTARGGGRPLPESVRAFFEPRFGYNFSGVRTHTNAQADALNQALYARAFTTGRDIFFRRAAYSPDSASGRKLLAHELTHVVQQQGRQVQGKPTVGRPGDKYEQEADQAARAIVRQTETGEEEKDEETGPAPTKPESIWGQRKATPVSLREAQPAIQRSFLKNIASRVSGVARRGLSILLRSAARLARRLPGYPLLTVILGRDPITDEPVERNATTLIRGFLSLIPGGDETFRNLQESGALERAFAWLNDQIRRLDLNWETIKGLFRRARNEISLSDGVSGAFARIKRIFEPPLARLRNFAVAVGRKMLEFIFDGVMRLAGPTGARVMAVIRQAGQVSSRIFKDPIGFLSNLLDAVKLGFNQFAGNIGKHLQTGLISWLTGSLASAGVALPESFNLPGIFQLVMQILGLSFDYVMDKISGVLGVDVKSIIDPVRQLIGVYKEEGLKGLIKFGLARLIGEQNMQRLMKVWEIIRPVMAGDFGKLWGVLKEYLTGLKQTMMGQIASFITQKVIVAGVKWVISLFNPASAVVKACLMIYDVIKFFIRRGRQIIRLATAVFDSIGNIAAGNISDAASFIEKALAKGIPVTISFLASLLGIGDLSKGVQKIIKSVRGMVDKAIDSLLNSGPVKAVAGFIKKIAGRVVSLTKAGFKKVKGVVGRVKAKPDVDYGTLDAQERPTGIKATLIPEQLGGGTKANPNIHPPGFPKKGSGKHPFARGHLLGNQLGGSGDEKRNLVTLHQDTNNRDMKRVEGRVRKAVDAGKIIRYEVEPIYQQNDLIPIGVTMKVRSKETLNKEKFKFHVTVRNIRYPRSGKEGKKMIKERWKDTRFV